MYIPHKNKTAAKSTDLIIEMASKGTVGAVMMMMVVIMMGIFHVSGKLTHQGGFQWRNPRHIRQITYSQTFCK